MTLIELKTSDQVLSIVTRPTIASGDQNTVGIKVCFDSAWDGYTKNATFSTATAPDVYEVILDDDACVVPFEVLTTPGTLYIGIRGIKANDGKVKTTTLVSYRIKEGAPIGTATAMPPTPDVYQQLLEKIGQIKGEPGEKGEKGDPGKDGKDGYTPQKGIDYFDGVDGKDGADGKNGEDGKDYILTLADKTEIAEEAAGKLQPGIDEISEELAQQSEAIEELKENGTGASVEEIHIGADEPTDGEKIWIDPEDEGDGLTAEDVINALGYVPANKETVENLPNNEVLVNTVAERSAALIDTALMAAIGSGVIE